jgi:hypothetical protein
MAAHEDSAWNLAPQRFNRATQALLVTLGTSPLRWSVGTQLTEQEI